MPCISHISYTLCDVHFTLHLRCWNKQIPYLRYAIYSQVSRLRFATLCSACIQHHVRYRGEVISLCARLTRDQNDQPMPDRAVTSGVLSASASYLQMCSNSAEVHRIKSHSAQLVAPISASPAGINPHISPRLTPIANCTKCPVPKPRCGTPPSPLPHISVPPYIQTM